MKQKVWVLDDKAVFKPRTGGPVDDQTSFGEKADSQATPETSQRNPALSLSLSMLLWGGGHIYLRHFSRGTVLMAAMGLFYAIVACLVLFRGDVSRWVAGSGLSASHLLVWGTVVLLLLLVAWLSSAVQVYYRTAGSRSQPFRGVDREYWPLLCSFLFPGWGQFLNGQPKKGLFFGLFGLMGGCSLLLLIVARQLLPLLQDGSGTTLFETSIVVAVAAIPLCLLMWVISFYDAFRTCGDPASKRPIMNRLQNLRYQLRMPGGARALVPEVRGTVLLGLLLVASVLGGIHYFPSDHYLTALGKVRLEMLDSNLEMLPELMGNIMAFIEG